MKNSKLTEDTRQKWLKILVNEMMSSEESGDEDKVVVHPLPWRKDYVNQMFHKIDDYCLARKSVQAKRQMKERSNGVLSTRAAPSGMPVVEN